MKEQINYAETASYHNNSKDARHLNGNLEPVANFSFSKLYTPDNICTCHIYIITTLKAELRFLFRLGSSFLYDNNIKIQ